MIKTLSAILLSGAIGAGGVVAYNRYAAPVAPAPVVDLSALNQVHTDLATIQQILTQQETAARDAQNAQVASMQLVHQDLMRAEAEREAVRAQAQARVNRLNSDFTAIQRAMPR